MSYFLHAGPLEHCCLCFLFNFYFPPRAMISYNTEQQLLCFGCRCGALANREFYSLGTTQVCQQDAALSSAALTSFLDLGEHGIMSLPLSEAPSQQSRLQKKSSETVVYFLHRSACTGFHARGNSIKRC